MFSAPLCIKPKKPTKTTNTKNNPFLGEDGLPFNSPDSFTFPSLKPDAKTLHKINQECQPSSIDNFTQSSSGVSSVLNSVEKQKEDEEANIVYDDDSKYKDASNSPIHFNLTTGSVSILTSINIPTPNPTENISQPTFNKQPRRKSKQNSIKKQFSNQNLQSLKIKNNNLLLHPIDSGLKSASVPSTPITFKMDADDKQPEKVENNQKFSEINKKVPQNPKNPGILLRRSESKKSDKSSLSSESSPLYKRGLAARRASACLPAPLSLDQISSKLDSTEKQQKSRNIKNLTLTTSHSNNAIIQNTKQTLLNMKIDMNKLANLPPNSPKCKQPAYEQGEPAEVLEYLFLGSAFHAQQDHFLEKFGITAVINCQKQEVKNMSDKVKVINIPIDDNAIADIKSHFLKVIEFIGK